MVKYVLYDSSDGVITEKLIDIRLRTLREVFGHADGYRFSDDIIETTGDYFLHGDHTTALAIEGENIVACASCCYVRYMPTLDHPTGIRGHIMGVYTLPEYRRQGIAKKLMEMLIEKAKEVGATELSLDATEDGARLYGQLGFKTNHECMNLII